MRMKEYWSIDDQGGELMYYTNGALSRNVKDLSAFSI